MMLVAGTRPEAIKLALVICWLGCLGLTMFCSERSTPSNTDNCVEVLGGSH